MDLLTRRQKHARLLYTRYNKKFFGGLLPRVPVVVEHGKLEGEAWGLTEWDSEGQVQQVSISDLNWDLDGRNSYLKTTILHELAHVKLGPRVGHDHPEWKAEALRLSKLGAFLEAI